MPQVMKIRDGKAAVNKEWKKIETIPAWQLEKVRRKKEVIKEAQMLGMLCKTNLSHDGQVTDGTLFFRRDLSHRVCDGRVIKCVQQLCDNWEQRRSGSVLCAMCRHSPSTLMSCSRIIKTVHFPSWMDTCHLKNAELEPRFQKYKGCVVLRGDIVKDDSGTYAVFTEQSSSESQMTAAKVMDVISKLPDCAGQAADAKSAYTQVKLEDAPKLLQIPKSECPDVWIRLPRHKWPTS